MKEKMDKMMKERPSRGGAANENSCVTMCHALVATQSQLFGTRYTCIRNDAHLTCRSPACRNPSTKTLPFAPQNGHGLSILGIDFTIDICHFVGNLIWASWAISARGQRQGWERDEGSQDSGFWASGSPFKNCRNALVLTKEFFVV